MSATPLENKAPEAAEAPEVPTTTPDKNPPSPTSSTSTMRSSKKSSSIALKKLRSSGASGSGSGAASAGPSEAETGSAAGWSMAANASDGGLAIPEPTEPERAFPGHGELKNVTDDAQEWYAKMRAILTYGVEDMAFADGKFKETITTTYPLRDGVNKIMFDRAITAAEKQSLVRFGRIYARAQGDSRDGITINQDYIIDSGLAGFGPALIAVLMGEAERRKAKLGAGDEEKAKAMAESIAVLGVMAKEQATSAETKKLKAIQATIARLELSGGKRSSAGTRKASAEK